MVAVPGMRRVPDQGDPQKDLIAEVRTGDWALQKALRSLLRQKIRCQHTMMSSYLEWQEVVAAIRMANVTVGVEVHTWSYEFGFLVNFMGRSI
jgi:hypothetical protein